LSASLVYDLPYPAAETHGIDTFSYPVEFSSTTNVRESSLTRYRQAHGLDAWRRSPSATTAALSVIDTEILNPGVTVRLTL
jgi:hypothetical protein